MTLAATEMRHLSAEELAEYRKQAKETFAKLDQIVQEQGSASTPPPTSWVSPNDNHDNTDLSSQQRSTKCRYFDTHGFLVVPNFATPDTVDALKQQMYDLANTDWDPLDQNKKVETFATGSAANTKRGDYFLDSSNQIHYFAEPTALDDHGKLKPEYYNNNNKLAALNKAGHGMHTRPGAFRDYTLSKKMVDLVTGLGWKQPVVPQSMYIFKQPQIGGTVHSHQDSTFLYTEPRQTCLGLWLALDDATLENGCLWVRPGSHREPVRRQFIRNPDYFNKKDEDAPTTNAPKLVFRTHHTDTNVTWEGDLPEDLTEAGFVPVEVKAGDLVTFCGTLDHLSLPNFSSLPRHTFQLHLIEGPDQGIAWSPENWLQYPQGVPFVDLLKGKEN